MKTIEAKRHLTDEEAGELAGKQLTEASYDTVVREDTLVLDEEGKLLARYIPNIIPTSLIRQGYDALNDAAGSTDNRGIAAGINEDMTSESNEKVVKWRAVKKDGTMSNTNRAASVMSGIVGYFDRTPRMPYCRQTSYTVKNRDKYESAIPMIEFISQAFKDNVPELYSNQESVVKETSPDFVIGDSVFTTVTVNANWQTAAHKDQGDYPDGCGVMTAMEAGYYEGCLTCFPEYRLAVDMRTRGILFANVHKWHGNTPFYGHPGQYRRLALVLYYRDKMKHCGSASDEVDRAKNRSHNNPMGGEGTSLT